MELGTHKACCQAEHQMHVASMRRTWDKIEPKACSIGSQRGIALLEARELLRANTGQPKVCKNFMFEPTLIELKSSSFNWPSCSVDSVLFR